jgi:hypothetical protein
LGRASQRKRLQRPLERPDLDERYGLEKKLDPITEVKRNK